MTRTLYVVAIAAILSAYAVALALIAPEHGGERITPPNTLVTVAPGWVSVNGESPVPECAEGDDCTGPDYR
jgi:hypothetical protein